MISIAIDRASLSLPDLVIEDSGTGTYVLMPGFSIGGQTPDNDYAESRWLPGAIVTGTRMTLTAVDGIVRVAGTDPADMQDAIDALAEALAQFSYTIDVTEGARTTTYSCCPASARRLFNRNEMRAGRDLVAVTIPRQP